MNKIKFIICLLIIHSIIHLACRKDNNSSNPLHIEKTLRLEPHDGNFRNSEGDFVWLKDGRLLFIYSYFTLGSHSENSGYLAGRFSSDSGKTWSSEDHLILENEAKLNIKSVSLLRLQDGSIALFYCRNNSNSDCIPMMRISTDETKSWSEPKSCIQSNGFYALVNDRVIQLKSGRIIVPVALAQTTDDMKRNNLRVTDQIMCFFSDDNGENWKKSQHIPNPTNIILQEPGVVDLNNGSLLLYCRSNTGVQYYSYSNDHGENWSTAEPSSIRSPRSPASMQRIPSTGDLLLVWNDNYNYSHSLSGFRTPLNIAISRDEGKTWIYQKILEDDPMGWFCYIAIEFTANKVILAYSAGTRRGKSKKLATEQVTRVDIDWLYFDVIH